MIALLAVTGALSLAVCVRAVVQRRYFEPLTIVAAVTLTSFTIRPAYLLANTDDLQRWQPAKDWDDAALLLDRSETAEFATTKLHEALNPALTGTTAAVTLFFVCFLVGYFLPVGRRARTRIPESAPRWPRSTSGRSCW